MSAETLAATFVASLAKNGHISVASVMFGGILVWGIIYMTKRLIGAINVLARAILWRFNITEAQHMAAFKELGEEVAAAARKAGEREAKTLREREAQQNMWKINGRRR